MRLDAGPRGYAEVQIDLGEMPPARVATEAPPQPRPPAGHRVRYRPGTGWAAALTAVLVLAALAGSAVPVPVPAASRVGFVPRSRGDITFGLDGDLLYAVSAPPVTVTRIYRIADRLIPWPRVYRGSHLGRTGGNVLVRSGDLCPDRVDGTIEAVDAATGAPRWSMTPADADAVASGYLLIARGPSGGPCTAANPSGTPPGRPAPAALATTALAVIDAATGATVWTLRARRDPAPSVGPGPGGRPAVLAVGADGTWIRRDLATGAPVAAQGIPAVVPTGPPGWVPWTGTPPLPPVDQVPGVATWGWVTQSETGILVVSGGSGATTVSVLDGDSLRPRWIATLAMPWPVQVVGCASRICVWTPAGTRALDAGTGRTAWTSPWYVTQPVGSHWALVATAAAADTPAALLDLRTGRVVSPLSGWRSAGAFPAVLDGDGELYPDSRPAGGGVLLYGAQPGRTWFARLDPDRGVTGPRVVASAPVELRACVAAGRYAACRSGAGSGAVSLWRLPG